MPLSSVVGAQSIIKPGVCTSSTRPAVPFEGQMIYETDTDKVLVYNGTAWYANWNLPWGYLTHSTLAAGTGLTGGAPTTVFNISYTHIANRRLRISGFLNISIPSATNTACRVQVNGTSVFYLDQVPGTQPSYSYGVYTNSTGSSQTFNVTLLYGSNPASAAVSGPGPAQFLLEDIGPA